MEEVVGNASKTTQIVFTDSGPQGNKTISSPQLKYWVPRNTDIDIVKSIEEYLCCDISVVIVLL